MSSFAQKLGFRSYHYETTFGSPSQASKNKTNSRYRINTHQSNYTESILQSPKPAFKKELNQKLLKKRNVSQGQHQIMTSLRDSISNIKQDIGRMISSNDKEKGNSSRITPIENRDDSSSCVDQLNPEQIESEVHQNSNQMKNSMIHNFNRFPQQNQAANSKKTCWSECNSLEGRKTRKQKSKIFLKTHDNLFKIPPMHPHQSTYSSQISGQSSYNNQASTHVEKLMEQNRVNKRAIKNLQQMVYDYQQGRRSLERQVKLLKKSSQKQSVQQSLKSQNFRLAELLDRQRYHRTCLQKKIAQMALQMNSNQIHSPIFNSESLGCNCRDHKNFQKQIRMLQDSYQTQICSLQTEIKLVKIMLQNYQQKKKNTSKKNYFVQTDEIEDTFSFQIQKRDLQNKLQQSQKDILIVISQKRNLQSTIHILQQQNQELKSTINNLYLNLQQPAIHSNKQSQIVQSLKRQLSCQQLKYTSQIQQVDAYCVQLQQQNQRLKNTSNVPLYLLSSFQKQIDSLKQLITHKNIKIQYLQEKILSGSNQNIAQFELEKINLITQIKQIQQNFNKQISSAKQQVEQMVKNCHELAQRFKMICGQVQRRDQFISQYLRQRGSQQDIKTISQKYAEQIYSSCTIKRIRAQRQQIQKLIQQNRILADFIDREGLNRIDNFISC